MLPVLMLAAATAQLATPQPAKPIITLQDYPEDAVEREMQGAVLFDVYVDPLGKPLGCKVERVFETDFGAVTCRKVQRTTFKPARDAEGNPAYGRFQSILNFWLPDVEGKFKYPLARLPDLSFTVKPSPALGPSRVVKLAAQIGVDGKVTECAPGGDKADVVWATAACSRLKLEWKDEPLQDARGTKRAYVREIIVAFVPDKAS